MSEYILYLILALTFSVFINVFLFWFAKKSSSRLTIVASNIDEIMSAIENFESHIETLYEMETFYGDETLHSVLQHAKGITEFLSESSAIDSTTQEEKKKTTKKVVFHSGS